MFDTDNMSMEDARLLREVCRQIKNKRDVSFFEFFTKHIGINVGQGYESNLGSGRASPDKVRVICAWIIAHELELASTAAPDMFEPSMRTSWQSFVEQRGTYRQLMIKPYTTGGLHEISDLHPISETRIKLGEKFTFELDSPIFGSVIALDHYKGHWYPMPLRGDGSFEPISIRNGECGFPINATTRLIVAMRQRKYDGEHGHCFIIGPSELMGYYANSFQAGQALSLEKLDKMAARLAEVKNHKLAICLENVIFD